LANLIFASPLHFHFPVKHGIWRGILAFLLSGGCLTCPAGCGIVHGMTAGRLKSAAFNSKGIAMKKIALSFLLACCLSGELLAQPAAPPTFTPEPPEPAALAFVNHYLELLAADNTEQALALNDLRGMRQYLLERRLAELQAHNPELTAAEIEEISSQLQMHDLDPARLRAILLEVMQQGKFTGMTWAIQGFAPAPEGLDGYLVQISARNADHAEKPFLLGIKKLGEQWQVAPEILEELNRQLAPARLPNLPPPTEVETAVDVFWTRWQQGELAEAYDTFAPEYRGKTSLLAFLQQAQSFVDIAGMPTTWEITRCRPLTPDTLGLGVDVRGLTATRPIVMVYRKAPAGWQLYDIQLQMPLPPEGRPPLPAGPAPFRSNLRPDLKPDLSTPAAPLHQAPTGPTAP